MAEVRVVVESEVRPTEDEAKVLKAVRAFFEPERVRFEEVGDLKVIVAESGSLRSLVRLHRMLRASRILDSARSALRRGIQGDRIVFHLHKQAAYNGRISFVSGDHESPLGSIRFTIEHPRPGEVVDWLAPRTSRGRPLWEREMPV